MVGEWQDEEVYRGAFLRVWARTLAHPMGGATRFEVVSRPDAVAIVALRRPLGAGGADAEPDVALVRQFRPALGVESLELPAGLIRADEAAEPVRAAQRELREETGATGGQWRVLTQEYSSPGFSTERITLYLADGVDAAADDAPQDPSEIGQIVWMPLSQALARCGDGTIVDGKTLLGLTLVSSTETLAPLRVGGSSAMPVDPTNAPFMRSARYRDPADPVDIIGLAEAKPATTAAGGAEANGLDTSLKLEDMLLEEFNYASVTAYQAMEDRARLFNNYLIIAAGGGVGVVGAVYQLNQIGARQLEGPLSAILFLLLGILGIAFFVSLLRVRQAYGGSLLAMTVIKEFYIAQFERTMPLAKYAFLWRLDGIPRNERAGSVTFVKTFTVGVLGSLSFGGFAFLLSEAFLPAYVAVPALTWISLAVGLGVALVTICSLYLYYGRSTSNAKAIDKAKENREALRSALKAPLS